jgi:hypothetical protein
MHVRRALFTSCAMLCFSASAVLAQGQGMPTTQPPIVTIYREQVKVGRAADHERIEAGWPAAYAKAKSTGYYLALTSLTGSPEAWFVEAYASNGAIGDEMKMTSGDTALSAELARLARADAEVIDNLRIIQTRARTDLSHGAYPDLSKMRFWEITTFRVRPGRAADFEAAAKAYGAASDRAGTGANYRVYEVTAGLTGGNTYYIFSSVESYGEFDSMDANGQKTWQALTADEQATMQKFSGEALINTETNRFALNPTMSYVSAETRATDPSFWMPKRAARRP